METPLAHCYNLSIMDNRHDKTPLMITNQQSYLCSVMEPKNKEIIPSYRLITSISTLLKRFITLFKMTADSNGGFCINLNIKQLIQSPKFVVL